jgi:hypothetical protein
MSMNIIAVLRINKIVTIIISGLIAEYIQIQANSW